MAGRDATNFDVLPISLLFSVTVRAENGQDCKDKHGVVSKERQAACDRAYNGLPDSIKYSIIDSAERDTIILNKDLLLSYDSACLDRLDCLFHKTRKTIENIFGVFFLTQHRSTDIVCTGFRITAHLVVTAAHCFWWQGAKLDPKALKFRLLAAPQRSFSPTKFEFSPEISDERFISDEDDYAVLSIDTSIVPFKQEDDLFRAQIPYYAYPLIVGVNIYDYRLRTPKSVDGWVDSLRQDRGRECFRIPTTEHETVTSPRCVISKCQTFEGMSGAPIFATDHASQKVFVGGIHLRSGLLQADLISRAYRECGNQQYENVGIVLPKQIVEFSLGQHKE